MRHFIALLIALAFCPADAAVAQTTAKGMYQKLQARETAARRALETGRPQRTVRHDINRIVVGYEGIVRRHPRSGYSDNALWQAAMLLADSYARYRVEEDRKASVRLLDWLIREYPASSLVPKARPALQAMKDAARDPGVPVEDVASITAIRQSVLPGAVRIAIELDRKAGFVHDRLSDPPRVFFDIAGSKPAGSLDNPLVIDGDHVKAVRFGPQPNGATRVVLDLGTDAPHKVFTLDDPFRIVVDIARESHARADGVAADASRPVEAPRQADAVPAGGADASLASDVPARASNVITPPRARPTPLAARPAEGSTTPAEAPAPPRTNLRGRYSLSRQLGLGVHRIVIDPGHGGHDPGARSRGVTEASLVLDVALRLEKLLLKDPGTEVILTRRTDVFVPLEERTAIANREGADLFLSIHANASRNSKARGIETYFLNFASNPEAEEVAARENSASGRTMHNLPDIVKAIALNNKLDESRDFATLVQRSMVEHLKKQKRTVRDLGVKQAPFVVLIGAGMPSVLAEISFVTHAEEGRLLKTASYRQQIAEALYQGIRRYQRSLKAVTTVASQE
ncbi:MAG TPA: N-acetylmuramoyl-L-alanine amidase [Vicinamibacterales bacterium]